MRLGFCGGNTGKVIVGMGFVMLKDLGNARGKVVMGS